MQIGAVTSTYKKVFFFMILLYRPHARVNVFLEIFCGVGGGIRHFVFEYCSLDVLTSFGQTSWLCCEAVQEYLKECLSFF